MYKLIPVFLLIATPFMLFSQHTISGDVALPNGVPICDVLVELRNSSNEVIAQDLSDENGDFQFADVADGGDYSLILSREGNVLNGASTFDIVLLFRIVLGIDQPVDPYSLWAADVNGSGQMTTLDMILMRRLILAIDQEFPLASWAFDEPGTPIPDNQVSIPNLSQNVDVPMIGVKRGDLNYSAHVGCQ